LKTLSKINKIVVGNLSWTNNLAYGTLDVKIFYQQGAPTKLSKPGGHGHVVGSICCWGGVNLWSQ